MINISANFTCTKCSQTFRAKFPEAKERGCTSCGAVYEQLTHVPVVVVDSREIRGHVPEELEKLGIEVCIVNNLDIGDFVVSDRCAFERKRSEDLKHDWLNVREFYSKLYDMSRAYSKPVFLFEGYLNELYEMNVQPESIDGMLNTIALMRVPLIETVNPAGTAKTLAWFAIKEQREKKRIISLHGSRSHLSPDEQLIYIASSPPGLGTSTAKSLLEQFKTIEALAGASIDDLMCVDGIGKKTAASVKEIMSRKYKGGK